MNLGELMTQHQDHVFVTEVIKGINRATWPWVLWRPTFFSDYDIVNDEDRILVEARFGKNLDNVYFHRLPFRREIMEPEALAALMIEDFTRGFRSWRLEPEDNIVLGEY